MFRAEDGGKMFLQTGDKFWLGYTASITNDADPSKK
jgi:hypothetical protein